MAIPALNSMAGPTLSSAAGAPARTLRQRSALESLGRTQGDDTRGSAAASQFLSQLFFAPLLAEMRKLPFGKSFSHGGRAEEVFAERLDQHVADIAAASSLKSLSGRIAEQLTRDKTRSKPALLPPVAWNARLAAQAVLAAHGSLSSE